MSFSLWASRVCVNTAIDNIKSMMAADGIDSVTKESLKLELTTLTNVGLRLGQLRKWLDVVDKDEETEQLEHARMVE